MDGNCFEAFLKHLVEAYAGHHFLIVLEGAPSHRSKEIACPQSVSLLRLPRYSPELNPVERWFQGFRRVLSNRIFETSSYYKRRSPKRLSPTGKSLLAYNDSPVSLGG